MTTEKFRQGIERLERRIEELDAFDPKSVADGDDPNLLRIETAISQTLSDVFGQESEDRRLYANAADLDPQAQARGYQSLGSRLNGDGIYQKGTPSFRRDVILSVTAGQARALGLLRQAIDGLKERLEYDEKRLPLQSVAPTKRVFIVHGHDEGAKEMVARFIQQLGLEPIILHEQANKGRTIITKFREEAADVGFAVVLMTPDDHGGKQRTDTRPRARQNVVFELGFFIGVLGPERVAALMKGDVEKPSDFDGVVYISLDHGHWKIDLAKELKAVGFEVDFNRVVSG